MTNRLAPFIFLLLAILTSCKKEKFEFYHGAYQEVLSQPDTICLPAPPARSNDEVIKGFFYDFRNAGFNGMAMVARQDTIIYREVFGYQTYENKDSMRYNTAMQLASVSKQFTAVAILQLVEDGKLLLSDTLGSFFPGFPYHGITVHHLLTHRSGLPNYMYFLEEYCTDKETPVSNQQLVQLMIQNEPVAYSEPDRRYQYSNTGYALLAAIVEKVTGRPFEDYMKQHVFLPAGMNNTWVYNKARNPLIKNKALGYTPSWVQYANDYMNGITGDKGVYSTLDDMYYWFEALEEGKLVHPSILRLAFEPYNPGMINSNYGYGWRIFKENGHQIAFHFGWWRGFKAFSMWDIRNDIVIVILTNRENLRLNDLNNLFSYLYPDNPPVTLLTSPRQG